MTHKDKLRLIWVALFTFAPWLIAHDASLIGDAGFKPIPIAAEQLKIITLLLIILLAFSYIFPWYIYIRKLPISLKPRTYNAVNRFIDPQLLLGYGFIFGTTIYGFMLLSLGISMSAFYFIVLASSLGAWVWGVLNFKRT